MAGGGLNWPRRNKLRSGPTSAKQGVQSTSRETIRIRLVVDGDLNEFMDAGSTGERSPAWTRM
jgi:hypothetical protein